MHPRPKPSITASVLSSTKRRILPLASRCMPWASRIEFDASGFDASGFDASGNLALCDVKLFLGNVARRGRRLTEWAVWGVAGRPPLPVTVNWLETLLLGLQVWSIRLEGSLGTVGRDRVPRSGSILGLLRVIVPWTPRSELAVISLNSVVLGRISKPTILFAVMKIVIAQPRANRLCSGFKAT